VQKKFFKNHFKMMLKTTPDLMDAQKIAGELPFWQEVPD